MKQDVLARRPQLLTYPDSLGGNLRSIRTLLEGPLAGLFNGVHVLPPFPSSGDRGFAPITYREIDPRFGNWEEVERIGQDHDVMLDVMINHISRASTEFRDFQRRGRASPVADLFITLDKIWPTGEVPAADLARIFLRRPVSPFAQVPIEETGELETVWATFGTADWSEQIDLDVNAPAARELITSWLRRFASHGVRIVRLDAIGYVVKQPGTSCFMVEPQIYAFLDWITDLGRSLGLVLLPEVHDRYPTHERLAAHGFWTYDFVMPALLLDALLSGDPRRLAEHIAAAPERQFTMLDCHDGIPVRPDLDGLLPAERMRALADHVVAHGGNVSRILSAAHAGDVDVHQLNTTWFSAMDADDDRHVATRAIQLFARGVPQVYYVGLLAGSNDLEAIARTGDGRAINRHDYTLGEIATAMGRPVVQRVMELVRLRNTHLAFEGRLHVDADPERLRLAWQHAEASLELEVDLPGGRARVRDGSQSWRPV
jgi:sucrose phosphorylase